MFCPWWLRRPSFDLWVRQIPWRKKQQPTPAFLPGEFHGQRSLVGYSPCGGKESKELDTTERVTLSLSFIRTERPHGARMYYVKTMTVTFDPG